MRQAGSRERSSRAAPPRWRCYAISRRISATSTASTISSFSSLWKRSAKCWTRSPEPQKLRNRSRTKVMARCAAWNRSWRNSSAPNRRSCACSICGSSSGGRSRACACRRAKTPPLRSERRVLQNLGRILETAGGAYAALYESPESAVVAGPAGRQEAGRAGAHRSSAGRNARQSQAGGNRVSRGIVCLARLPGRSRSESGAARRDRNAAGGHR